jgi:hypothetical protein
METAIFEEIIGLIKREKQRREWLLKGKDPDFAQDQWLFTDAPFVNELYLMLLITLRHQVERELVCLAARAVDDEPEISHITYLERLEQLRNEVRKPKNWDKKIEERLNLQSFREYLCIEILRLLSNSYKHNQFMEPDIYLLAQISLDSKINYASLPESDAFRKGLAEFIGLEKDADYCEITFRFVDIACKFLTKVEMLPGLSRVRPGTVSLNPKDFAE